MRTDGAVYKTALTDHQTIWSSGLRLGPRLGHRSVQPARWTGTLASCLMYDVFINAHALRSSAEKRKNIPSGKRLERGAGWISQQPAGLQRSGGV